MTRLARWLPLLGWTMAAACSGGGEESRGPAASDPAASDPAASGDAPRAATPAPTQSISIGRGTVPMTITGRVAATAGAQAEGRGGTLTVNGKDDHGHDIELSIRCERFDEVVAEGG